MHENHTCIITAYFYRLVHHVPLAAAGQKHQAVRPHHTLPVQNPTQAALKTNKITNVSQRQELHKWFIYKADNIMLLGKKNRLSEPIYVGCKTHSHPRIT